MPHNTQTDDRRPDPDALLKKIKRQEAAANRGRLRIYLGAAPGVGKTYAMLQEGRRRAKRGTDVVVGYVETYERPLTKQALEGLEVISRRRIEYHGVVLEEMDTDAVIARRPRLAAASWCLIFLRSASGSGRRSLSFKFLEVMIKLPYLV